MSDKCRTEVEGWYTATYPSYPGDVQFIAGCWKAWQAAWIRRAQTPTDIDSIAHEIWAAAQLMPYEGIEGGVARVEAILSRAPAEQIPSVLFDGYTVYQMLSDRAKHRTSAENVSDVLDAVVKAIKAEVAPAEQWMDISSAPKNGATVLLYNGQDVATGYFSFFDRDRQGQAVGADPSEQCLCVDQWEWCGHGSVCSPQPTHFMPLPSPPKEEV